MKTSIALIAVIALAAPLIAQDRAPFRIEASGKTFYRLDDAVKAVGDGDATILIAPGTYPDCVVQRGGNITYRGTAPGQVIFDGGACDGKGTLVLAGLSATVEGLIFQNIRVPDRNGSGIRLEKGDLTVTNSMFRNSEQGILTANDPTSQIVIDQSTFSGLGGCPNGQCSHSLYIGDFAKLTVTRSRFERGTGGHYVKARTRLVSISDSSFDDTNGKETNYMIDLPAGAKGVISGNEFVQGANKENHSAFITVAPESRDFPSAGLTVINNSGALSPRASWPSVFVADWSHEPLKISANRLGKGLTAYEAR
ncbi:MAG: right-handed parallel beta-helix repeat-containing protein [Sphingomonadaceae bacterium]